MKVVILHQHFNTPEKGGPLRSYFLAKALTNAGISVTVVTAHNAAGALTQISDGIEVHYLPVKYENRFGFYSRVSSFFKFMVLSTRVVARLQTVDLIYAISVPLTVGLAARRIKARQNVPYIFEVGDLWPDAPIELGFLKNKVLISLLKNMERQIYKKANCIVALSEPIAKAVAKRAANKPIHIIPNMSDVAYFADSTIDRTSDSGFGSEFVITYAGAIGYANGLDFLIACARVAQREQLGVRFVICGEGAMRDSLHAAVRTLNLSNVTFVAFSTREQVRQILNQSNACFICYRSEPILETGSPNKYFDALAAGKPVIVNFGGWIRNEIEDKVCGVYVNSRDPESFVAAVRPMIEDRTVLQTFGNNARALALRKYSREELSARFVSVIKGCV